MNTFQTKPKLALRSIAVVALVLLLPSIAVAAAPKKTYSLQFGIDPATQYGTDGQLIPPATMSVGIKNESPPPNDANSNIGSFTFTLAGMVMVSSPATGTTPPSPYCPRAQCSISADGTVLTVTNISPPVQATATYNVTFQVSSCGDGTVTSAGVFSGSQLSGAAFQTKNFNNKSNVACGSIACGEQFPVPVSTASCSASPNDLNCVTIKRGLNKDGLCTAADDVSYFVTNTLPTASNLLHVEWATDNTAAFAYKLNAATGGTPKVSWLSSSTGEPIFIDADTCRPDPAITATDPPASLPFPRRYGALAGAVSASDKKITVTLDASVAPPAVGDPIVIGGERLVVTKVVNGQWTVDRRTGGTPVDPNVGTSYLAGQPVMFTPLKLVSSNPTCYKADGSTTSCSGTYGAGGKQAQMCRASPINGTAPGPFNYWIMDIGDGYVKPAA